MLFYKIFFTLATFGILQNAFAGKLDIVFDLTKTSLPIIKRKTPCCILTKESSWASHMANLQYNENTHSLHVNGLTTEFFKTHAHIAERIGNTSCFQIKVQYFPDQGALQKIKPLRNQHTLTIYVKFSNILKKDQTLRPQEYIYCYHSKARAKYAKR